MRKPLIAGNWKMYKTPKESLAFLNEFLPLVRDHAAHDITLFPTMSSLGYVIEAVKGTNVSAGAQTMHWLNEGPYTGQTSPTMLASISCTHVMLGHSERRIYANETDDMVNWKLKAALAHNLIPIVCVGESQEKRQSGLTEAVLNWQIACALNGIRPEHAGPIVIAYEPIWAIGTGSVATPDQVSEAHAIIRREVAVRLGKHSAERMRILYGGSVKPENIAKLMVEPEIDGVLVGGASLDPHSFAQLIHNSVRSSDQKQ
ncbi:triose-phosphate isomerase [Granulicella arctica]|uniref:Triosephosphate isomerase n=1 Tax=Granulicella arctica TaxID=940613 RepID=A0A7Y9TUJ8_9BACT|nr:triose-phosphate isomerase [Granulicella arctica]NYF80938.1 triosephosphate isomerase [Granulicella arctica]